MTAYIVEFSCPSTIEEMVSCLLNEREVELESFLDETYPPNSWEVPPDCQVGDLIFFVCGETNFSTLQDLVQEVNDLAPDLETYLENLAKKTHNPKVLRLIWDYDLVGYVEEIFHEYEEYDSSVLAVARVASPPVQMEKVGEVFDGYVDRWHARLRHFRLLSEPVPYFIYHDYLDLAEDKLWVKLTEEEYDKLLVDVVESLVFTYLWFDL